MDKLKSWGQRRFSALFLQAHSGECNVGKSCIEMRRVTNSENYLCSRVLRGIRRCKNEFTDKAWYKQAILARNKIVLT